MANTRLSHLLSTTILVGVPNLTSDLRPIPFKLAGIEDCGLWLEEIEASTALAPYSASQAESSLRTLLIPYTQIAYVMANGTPVRLTPNGDATRHAKKAKPEPAVAGKSLSSQNPVKRRK